MKKIVPVVLLSFASLLMASCSTSSTSSSSSGTGYYKAVVDSYRVEKHPSLGMSPIPGMPSTGNVKILVVPVCFSGSDDPSVSQDNLDTLQKAYFGKSSDTSWESLSSYYKKSSYGKLAISGTITKPYKDSRSCLEFENDPGIKTSTLIKDLISSIISYGTTNWDLKTSDYDSDKDGIIDAIELIYFTSRPLLNQGGSSVWWAMTDSASYKPVANVDNPVPCRFFWAPYSLISPGYYDSPSIDTHVLVHETGHAMGLVDYYSYAAGDNAVCPSGGIDMMDFNVGDHNAYSKMILGWANPYVIDGSKSSFSMTLNSFTDTGECIILRDTKTDKWNGMPYDEYFLLQYYTPSYLNEQDSKGYKEWEGKIGYPGTYQSYGLQVFHIDARLYTCHYKFNATTNTFEGYSKYMDTIKDSSTTDETTGFTDSYSLIAASNTLSSSCDVEANLMGSPNCLLSIIPASKTTNFLTKNYKSSVGLMSNLFGVGDEYGSSSFSMSDYSANMTHGTTFNDGSTPGYSFKVTSNGASSCTLAFTAE